DALAARTRRAAVVWDPHPRGGPPVPGVRLATPNRAEACGFAPEVGGHELAADARRAALLAQRWRAGAVAVTLGAGGALLGRGADSPMLIPAPYAAPGDPCGAGDCFAATTAAALADGRIAEEAVERAVLAAADFVAAGGVSAARTWTDDSAGDDEIPSSAQELAASVRARGGTVVATGGCFDLLHAGHVGLLESARRLGDCLVVCLNSDDSVRRLKGAGRPLNSATDRARVLLGLGCVDAVAVFDEDTPEAVLRTLRPHLWVKGGDYTAAGLPEAAALAEWGGDALVLPYLDGHSTSALARRAALATEATPP
ncbi:PfkB family carbohydrate kinase, partial [Streptacidiphilus monticola]